MSDTAQLLSTAFLALLNGAALLLIYLEYRRNSAGNTRFAVLAQGLVLAWHGLVVALILLPDNRLVLATSALVIFLAAASSLLATRRPRKSSPRRLFRIVVSIAAPVFVIGGYFVSWVPALAWLLTGIMLFLLPVMTLLSTRAGTRWILALLQVLVAFCFVGGIAILNTGEPANGALLYFMMLVLVPAITLVYLQASIEASARHLHAWEQQLEHLYDSVGETFFELSAEGRITRLSAAIETFGYSREELLGQPLNELFQSGSELAGDIAGVRQQPLTNQPVQLVTAAGQVIDCEISAIWDESAGRGQIIGSLRNVQERNQIEQQFFEAQRRDSLGRLAAGVAHDFNNILQSMVSHAQLGLYSSSDDQVTARLKAIVDSASVASSICQQLLQYTGNDAARRDEINLDTAIRDVLQMLMPALPADVELKYNASPDAVRVTGDKTQLQQIIMNLVQNAVDATRGGLVEVSLQLGVSSRQAAPDLSIGPDVEDPAKVICLEVSDTGRGISVDDISRVFDPFYTTREEGHGLGLAAVTGILENHSGTLNVWTRVPGGTTMQILLPAGAALQPTAALSSQPGASGEQTVLYAEDNDAVRMATKALLENLGFNVIAVRNGHEAVDMFARMQDQVSLFMSDIRMPLKDGIEAAREICRLKSVPVLLASGYSEFGSRLSQEEFSEFHYIQKPFTLDKLKAAVTETVTTRR